MLLWMGAGYCLVAVLFYLYIVATAQHEPEQNVLSLYDTEELTLISHESYRKAA